MTSGDHVLPHLLVFRIRRPTGRQGGCIHADMLIGINRPLVTARMRELNEPGSARQRSQL
jgi:hypothetical protein